MLYLISVPCQLGEIRTARPNRIRVRIPWTSTGALAVTPPIYSEPSLCQKSKPILLSGGEFAGEMKRTLFRLPYLPLLGNYYRPCRPLLACSRPRFFTQRMKKSLLADSPDTV